MLHCAWCCFGSFTLACMNNCMWCTNVCKCSNISERACRFMLFSGISVILHSLKLTSVPNWLLGSCTVLTVGTALRARVWRNMFVQDVTVSVISFNSIWVKYISPQCRVSVWAPLIISQYGFQLYVDGREMLPGFVSPLTLHWNIRFSMVSNGNVVPFTDQ